MQSWSSALWGGSTCLLVLEVSGAQKRKAVGQGLSFPSPWMGGGTVAAGDGTHLGHDEPVAWEVGKKLEAGATQGD